MAKKKKVVEKKEEVAEVSAPAARVYSDKDREAHWHEIDARLAALEEKAGIESPKGSDEEE